jgi:hypothetical protein
MSWELECHPENGCFSVYAKATSPQIFQIRPTTFSSTTALTLRHPDGPEAAVPGTLRPSDMPITDQAKELVYI